MQSLISVDEATHAVHAQARLRATETVALTDAVGRVLADDITAERAHPPFDRVTTDGIATRWLPVTPALLRVVGAQTAGHHGQALHEASAFIARARIVRPTPSCSKPARVSARPRWRCWRPMARPT